MDVPARSSNAIMWGIIGAVLTVLLLIMVPMSYVNVDMGHITVVQSLTGNMDVYTTPGPRPRFFGKVTTYSQRKQYVFCTQVVNKVEERCPGADADGKKVRFSEGGHAIINGAVSWEMPMDKDSILKVQSKFGSEESIEQAAVSKMIDSAVYFSGPMMTSTESSGARRGDLVNYINDQAMHGIYVTESSQEVVKDVAGKDQTVTVTEVVLDKKTGKPLRQQGSILEEFHITLMPIAINELRYDSVVEKQIADRQASTTAVQLAIAASTQAEQAAKTAASQGMAKAAEAKWTQEAIKAKEVTLAQQELEVAVLRAKKAEAYKRQQILEGEGDAAKAKLKMQANGALEQKLAAYVEVNKAYAQAIEKHEGSWVPTTIIGAMGNGVQNASQALMEMFTVKTAKDLSLDMNVKK